MDVATRFREYARFEKKRAAGGLTPAELRRWVAIKRMLSRSFSPHVSKGQADQRASLRVPTRLGASFATVGEIRRNLMTNLSRGGGLPPHRGSRRPRNAARALHPHRRVRRGHPGSRRGRRPQRRAGLRIRRTRHGPALPRHGRGHAEADRGALRAEPPRAGRTESRLIFALARLPWGNPGGGGP